MKIKEFNKLVRDRIPEIIEKANKQVFSKILDSEDFLYELIKKRNEEFLELEEALAKGKINQIVEEMADLLLVEETIRSIDSEKSFFKIFRLIEKLRKDNNVSRSKLKRVYNIKNKEKGKFNKKIFLLKTQEND